MSTIDRAFVKAYAKEQAAPAAPPSAAKAAAAPSAAAAAVGGSDASVVWIDPVDDRYLRLDRVQSAPAPHPSRPGGGQPAAAPQSSGPPSPAPQPSTTGHQSAQPQAAAPALQAAAAALAEHAAAPAPQPFAAAAPAAAPQAKKARPFEAAWEVDSFELPELVVQLMTDGGLLVSAGMPLADACRGGLKTLLVTSPGRGEGKTSVAIGLALAVASRGLRVALLDSDSRSAAIADRFRLEIQFGWAEAIRSGLALEETAVHSIEDALTLLPLVPAEDGKAIAADELRRAVADLRRQFDLVVIDAGSDDDGRLCELPRQTIDAALVIRDIRAADAEGLSNCLAALREAGISSLGLADNFAS